MRARLGQTFQLWEVCHQQPPHFVSSHLHSILYGSLCQLPMVLILEGSLMPVIPATILLCSQDPSHPPSSRSIINPSERHLPKGAHFSIIFIFSKHIQLSITTVWGKNIPITPKLSLVIICSYFILITSLSLILPSICFPSLSVCLWAVYIIRIKYYVVFCICFFFHLPWF